MARGMHRARTLALGLVLKLMITHGLAATTPTPVLTAVRLSDAEAAEWSRLPAGDWGSAWGRMRPVWLDQSGFDGRVRADLATEVRAAWSSTHLHLAFRSPYTRLTTFEPAETKERIGLWERDVVEAFIGSDLGNVRRYAEFQVAPNGMKLDLKLDLPKRDFEWDSGMTASAVVDEARRIWSAKMSIPLRALGDAAPVPGTRWRINLFRCDYANNAFLAWRPTMQKTFHVPERFGVLEFGP